MISQDCRGRLCSYGVEFLYTWASIRKLNNIIRMGVHKQRQGLLTEAEAALLHAWTSIGSGTQGFEREESYTLANLGSVYQDQGRYDQALKILEKGLDLTRQLQDNYLV